MPFWTHVNLPQTASRLGNFATRDLELDSQACNTRSRSYLDRAMQLRYGQPHGVTKNKDAQAVFGEIYVFFFNPLIVILVLEDEAKSGSGMQNLVCKRHTVFI